MAFHLTGLIDVAAHLTDPMFKGVYDGSRAHDPDVKRVLSRAWDFGFESIVIAATTLKSSKKAYKLAKTDKRLFSTAGCHPTRVYQMAKDETNYPRAIYQLAEKRKKVVAIGQCGLDFRPSGLDSCSKKLQIKYFKWQLEIAKLLKMPMLLFCRGDGSFDEMMDVLNRKHEKLRGGIIHSFVGTAPQAKEFIRKGFLIGLTGCSLKKTESLDMLKELPLNKIALGSSAPYCVMSRPDAGFKHIKTKFSNPKKTTTCSPDGMVLGRNEPSHVIHVTEVVAAIRKLEMQELTDIVNANVKRVFLKKPKLEPEFD